MSKTLSERIKEFLSSIKSEEITRDFEELCEKKLRALEKEVVDIREAKLFNRGYIASSTISLNLIQELQAENQALQTKIKTLEDLNAISYDANARLSKENQALLAKNEELQAENKSWQEMVDSVNQTNRAMGNMLNKLEAKNKELEEENQILKSRLKKISDAFEDHCTGYDEIELMAKGII